MVLFIAFNEDEITRGGGEDGCGGIGGSGYFCVPVLPKLLF